MHALKCPPWTSGAKKSDEATLRELIQQMPQDNTPGVVLLDIYSGSGTHGHICEATLRQHLMAEGKRGGWYRVNVARVSIDFDPPANAAHPPTFRCNVFAFTRANIRLLKAKFPRKKVCPMRYQHRPSCMHMITSQSRSQWIILGSPPCQFWSQANTVGDKGEESAALARALVTILHLFYEVLQAVFMVRYSPNGDVRSNLHSLDGADMPLSLFHEVRRESGYRQPRGRPLHRGIHAFLDRGRLLPIWRRHEEINSPLVDGRSEALRFQTPAMQRSREMQGNGFWEAWERVA